MVDAATPGADETLALASNALALAKAIGARLDEMTVDDPAFFPLKTSHQQLIANVSMWTSQGINLATGNTGEAVDTINAATAALKKAQDTVKNIAADVGAVLAFAKLAAAITAGDPAAIISTGTSFLQKAKALA